MKSKNGHSAGAANGRQHDPARCVLITGGAGFIGANLAARLLAQGRRVIIYDNLSRPGVETNLTWLRQQYGEQVRVRIGDTRDALTLREVVAQADQVFHLAAQVAVTTSLVDPMLDFEINVRGTLNLLEAMRACKEPPSLVFTSTNKVYGELADLRMLEKETRYEPLDPHLRRSGVSERRPLDFHSPYGCSKGAADQYIIDYARIYDVPTVVFRMSCIYGPHQFGTEDQGWVAHFLIRALAGEPLTLYGDGKQVRDTLFVEDLVNALLLAQEHMATLSGQAFNIGGSLANTISLKELIELIEEITGRTISIERSSWRPGDQKYYVSDVSKFSRATGWQPRVSVREGVGRLCAWLLENRRSDASTSLQLRKERRHEASHDGAIQAGPKQAKI